MRRGKRLVLAALLLAACGDADVGEPVGWVEQPLMNVCADDQTVEGIDVSYYQGSIDWSAVAADGVVFGITRVNHGGFMDPEFDANWQGMKDVGILRGAYQYFDAGSDPVEQANVMVDKVGPLGPGDLPAVIDIEATDGQSAATIAANVGTWIDIVAEGTGRQPVIYTGPYFWQDNVGSAEFVDHPLWIAHYTTGCPLVPDPWPKWRMWQYTSSGAVDGIDGNVDRNRYNGSIESLEEFAGNGWRAGVLSLSYPDTLAPGETATVTIELENAGSRAWSANTHLGTTEPRDRQSPFTNGEWLIYGTRAAGFEAEVASGATATLTFPITAPEELGSYTEHFNLVEEGVAWFSDSGGPNDDAIALAIDVVSSESSGVGGGGGGGEVDDDGRRSESDSCAYEGGPAKSSFSFTAMAALGMLGVRRRSRRSWK